MIIRKVVEEKRDDFHQVRKVNRNEQRAASQASQWQLVQEKVGQGRNNCESLADA